MQRKHVLKDDGEGEACILPSKVCKRHMLSEFLNEAKVSANSRCQISHKNSWFSTLESVGSMGVTRPGMGIFQSSRDSCNSLFISSSQHILWLDITEIAAPQYFGGQELLMPAIDYEVKLFFIYCVHCFTH